MIKKDLIIGFAPTRRNAFNKEDALKYKNKIYKKISSFGYNVRICSYMFSK